jgi:hypothetical protein
LFISEFRVKTKAEEFGLVREGGGRGRETDTDRLG